MKNDTHPPMALRRRTLLQGGAAGLFAATPIAGMIPAAFAAGSAPVVRTTAGPVRGTRSGHVSVFKGIPYAASTAGEARFMPPQPPAAWTEVRDASHYGPRSHGLGYPPILMPEEGVDLDKSPEGEDSLVVNVWTPGLDTKAKRPVMVWYHGGGFTSGSGGSVRYDGTRLAARHGVVVVTVNHRIGALGFLHLAGLDPRYARSANLGMQDIVMSLRWVRDNIARFGGNPHNVTVFGESGGGQKVSTLMGMPSAKGLFHRAIAESGTGVRWPSAEEGTKMARAVLEKLGVAPDNLAALHQLPPEKIAAATPPNIGPVVDGEVLPRSPFDPEGPAVSADVPMLLGSNLTEVTFFNNTPLDPIDDATLQQRIADFTKLDADKAAGLVAQYRKGRPDAPNQLLYQVIASDWWMGGNVHVQAERKAAQGRAPAYVYQFAMPQGARGGKLNVPHTSEIAYVFDNLQLSTALVGEVTPAHQALADRMSAAWVNFARTGNPNGRGLPAWKPYSRADRQVMVFGPQVGPAPAAVVDGVLAVNALKSA